MCSRSVRDPFLSLQAAACPPALPPPVRASAGAIYGCPAVRRRSTYRFVLTFTICAAYRHSFRSRLPQTSAALKVMRQKKIPVNYIPAECLSEDGFDAVNDEFVRNTIRVYYIGVSCVAFSFLRRPSLPFFFCFFFFVPATYSH